MKSFNFNISIIIPVYNSEKYINQCLESLLTQNTNFLEIICINDASTDNTESILNEYSKSHDNIKVFKNVQNSGPAYSRNIGLEHAKGDYIWFIDSDDWIQSHAIEALEKLLHQTNADIIGFRAQAYNNKTRKIYLNNFRDLSIIPDSFFFKDFSFHQGKDFLFQLPQELWCRIFRKDFLKTINIKFDTEVWGLDDGIFVNECFVCSKKIFFSKDILYNYRTHNSQSIISRLGKPDPKTYNIPILYAKKCDQIIKKHQLQPEECKTLIFRNIDRIIHMYSKIKGPLKITFFNEFKAYLISSRLRDLPFVTQSSSYSLLKNFEDLNYWQYLYKNFIFQIYESNTLKRITIFQFTIHKRQTMHNLIKTRSILSIFKTMTHIRSNYKEIHYLFLGILIFKRKKLT